MKQLIRFVLVSFALLIGTTAHAVDPLLITSGNDRSVPIAVVPFGYKGGALPQDMAQIVSDDLRNSGSFEPIARQNMISQPATPQELIFRDWQAVGAQYVLIGNIAPNGARLQVSYALFNVATQQQVTSGTISGAVDQIRDLAHHIADKSYESMTGIRGAFSTRLLYVTAERFSEKNTKYALIASDYDGARPVTLLQSREPIVSPRFSADGRRLAYVSFEQKRPRIFIQEFDTGRRQQVTDFEGLNGAPAWSPDGTMLAFVLSKDGNPEIYVKNLASGTLRRVTNHQAIDTEPFWGKDNQTIYFTSDRSGRPQIYKMNINSGATERVTFVGNYNANPKLSADEKTLVMIHRQEGYRVFQVAAQDLERGNLRILSQTSLDESPTVAPNGTMIIYATRQQGKGVLMLTSINGRVRMPLPTVQGDVREPAWSPFLN